MIFFQLKLIILEELMHKEHHFSNRLSWLRAAVMGANDGIISMSGLVLGLASSSMDKGVVFLAALTGLIAGALSMGVGEYISVSSQSDSEKADIKREEKALSDSPKEEFKELVAAYEKKGLSSELATKVARELSDKDALKAHLSEELNYDEDYKAMPFQAGIVSLIAFFIGGGIPVSLALLSDKISIYLYPTTILSLVLLGFVSAKLGGVAPLKSILRVTLLGLLVLFLSQFISSFY
jgi:VIT1/CCC1 family predicted Fe2+/Mn2+ transporter